MVVTNGSKPNIIPLNIPMGKQYIGRKKHFHYLQNRNTVDLIEAFFSWV